MIQRQLGVLVDDNLMRKIDDYRAVRRFSRSDVVRIALLKMLNGHTADEQQSVPEDDAQPQEQEA